MNIILYGIPADTAGDCRTLRPGTHSFDRRIGTCGALLPVPKITAPRQLLALYNALMRHEDAIDAVIICGSETCGAAGTICYGAPPGKIFTLCGDPGGEEPGSGVIPAARCHLHASQPDQPLKRRIPEKTKGILFSNFSGTNLLRPFPPLQKSAGKNFHNRLSPRNRPCS